MNRDYYCPVFSKHAANDAVDSLPAPRRYSGGGIPQSGFAGIAVSDFDTPKAGLRYPQSRFAIGSIRHFPASRRYMSYNFLISY